MGPSKPMPDRDIIAIDVGRDEGGFCPTGCVWGGNFLSRPHDGSFA